MPPPEFWIVAGPNGAGKTTCVQREPIARFLPKVAFLNPDDRTLSKLQLLGYRGFGDAPNDVQFRAFIESADEVYVELESAIARKEAVGVETVLSSHKYQRLVESVVAANGFLGLIYVALSSPEIARERVAARVRLGGHGVPIEKIEARWQRSLDNLSWFAGRASAFYVVDNSRFGLDITPMLVAYGTSYTGVEFLAGESFPALIAALKPLGR
jgi:predicted ABC-type ATPase